MLQELQFFLLNAVPCILTSSLELFTVKRDYECFLAPTINRNLPSVRLFHIVVCLLEDSGTDILAGRDVEKRDLVKRSAFVFADIRDLIQDFIKKFIVLAV